MIQISGELWKKVVEIIKNAVPRWDSESGFSDESKSSVNFCHVHWRWIQNFAFIYGDGVGEQTEVEDEDDDNDKHEEDCGDGSDGQDNQLNVVSVDDVVDDNTTMIKMMMTMMMRSTKV